MTNKQVEELLTATVEKIGPIGVINRALDKIGGAMVKIAEARKDNADVEVLLSEAVADIMIEARLLSIIIEDDYLFVSHYSQKLYGLKELE